MGTNDEVKRSDDSISRQEAIKAVSDLYAIYGSEGEWVDRRDVFNALKKMPSAQSERPKGKWIEKSTNGEMFSSCSVCGYIEWDAPRNFCPNCGSDNRGEQDE